MEYGKHDGTFRADRSMHRSVSFEEIHARSKADMGRVLIVKTALQHHPLNGTDMPVYRRHTVLFKADHE